MLTIEDRAERNIRWVKVLSWVPWVIAVLFFALTLLSTSYSRVYQESPFLRVFGLSVIWSIALIPILMIALPLLAGFNWYYMSVRDRVIVMVFGLGGCVISSGIIIYLFVLAMLSG